MKFCTKCGNELRDEAVICPKCGCACEVNLVKTDTTPTQGVKYCNYCGAEVLKEAVVCPKCGCPLKANRAVVRKTGTALPTTTKVFLVIGCVLPAIAAFVMAILSIVISNMTSGLELETNFGVMYLIMAIVYLLPLIWRIPMTNHYFKASAKKEPVGIGFKVCTLLFVNLIAGILMLCDTSNNK